VLSPRLAKIVRDLSSNLPRTSLVVLSIAVGIFATGAILGARQVLLREFEVDLAASQKASITFAVSGADQSLIDRVAAHESVVVANGRRLHYARIRSLTQDDDGTLTSSWDALELNALVDFDRDINNFEPVATTAWPPRVGDVLIEQSALVVFDYRIGDAIEIDTGSRTATFTVAGFVHDINAIPARFFRQVTAYTTLESMDLLGEPQTFNVIDVRVDPALSRLEVSRVATDIKDRILSPANVQVRSTSIPEPG
jgi:putative ABC transport system permease protein